MEGRAEQVLADLHQSLLKSNLDDEGDLLFYRITYRLADQLGISAAEAGELHREFHQERPRRISQGHCGNCRKVVTIIPIIYAVSDAEVAIMKAKEREGRLIIGDTSEIRGGRSAALFGCSECKTPLPQYGTS